MRKALSQTKITIAVLCFSLLLCACVGLSASISSSSIYSAADGESTQYSEIMDTPDVPISQTAPENSMQEEISDSDSNPCDDAQSQYNNYPTEWNFTDGTRTLPPQTVQLNGIFLDWTLIDLSSPMKEKVLATFEGEIKTKGIVVSMDYYPVGYCLLFFPHDDSEFPRSYYDKREGGIFCVLRDESVFDAYNRDGPLPVPNQLFGIQENEECRFECEIVLTHYKVYSRPSAGADVGIISKIIEQGEKQPLGELLPD